MSCTPWQVVSAVLFCTLVLTINKHEPGVIEVAAQPPPTASQPTEVAALSHELSELRKLIAQQQSAAKEHRSLMQELKEATHEGSTTDGTPPESQQPEAQQPNGAAVLPAVAPAAGASDAAQELERTALGGCKLDDVPILRLLLKPCAPGMHGFDCDIRWDMDDRFLPDGRRWQAEFNASRRAVIDCQRGFFDAFADRLTLEHWETEWDAQPFRIAASPPRTLGKMMHQLTTANYFQLTSPPARRMPLRQKPAPGSNYVPMPVPGFRWNVVDYGRGNSLSAPLGRALQGAPRCKGRRAWHCLWQRFPLQQGARAVPPADSALGVAAQQLYNLSLTGRAARRMLQYLVMAGVTQVFSEPTAEVRGYIADHLRVLCHVGGPHCGGSADEQRTPVAAMHVRQGDSCDRHSDQQGPFNSMFAWDAKKGKLDRVGFRYCYSWSVYLAQLRELRARYGVRTVYLMTDDATGKVVGGLAQEKGFNWAYLDYPRTQFQKRGWMEFRTDLNEHFPFSLAAALELLGGADMLVGNMGSHVTRVLYNKMVSSAKTQLLPPFVSVDGYGMCCDFTEDCSKEDIRKRKRPIRDCIHKYGQCTGGDQWFFHRG